MSPAALIHHCLITQACGREMILANAPQSGATMSHQVQLLNLDIHPIVSQHKSLLEGLGVGEQVCEFCTYLTGYKTIKIMKPFKLCQ